MLVFDNKQRAISAKLIKLELINQNQLYLNVNYQATKPTDTHVEKTGKISYWSNK